MMATGAATDAKIPNASDPIAYERYCRGIDGVAAAIIPAITTGKHLTNKYFVFLSEILITTASNCAARLLS